MATHTHSHTTFFSFLFWIIDHAWQQPTVRPNWIVGNAILSVSSRSALRSTKKRKEERPCGLHALFSVPMSYLLYNLFRMIFVRDVVLICLWIRASHTVAKPKCHSTTAHHRIVQRYEIDFRTHTHIVIARNSIVKMTEMSWVTGNSIEDRFDFTFRIV